MMLLLKDLGLMYLVKTIGAMRENIYNENRAINAFVDDFQLANADRYSSQYFFLMGGIGVNSYSFQGSDLMCENDILGRNNVQD